MSSADMESSRLQGLNRRAIALRRATRLPYNVVALSSCSVSWLNFMANKRIAFPWNIRNLKENTCGMVVDVVTCGRNHAPPSAGWWTFSVTPRKGPERCGFTAACGSDHPHAVFLFKFIN